MYRELSFDMVLETQNDIIPDILKLGSATLHPIHYTRVYVGIEVPTLNVLHVRSF